MTTRFFKCVQTSGRRRKIHFHPRGKFSDQRPRASVLNAPVIHQSHRPGTAGKQSKLSKFGAFMKVNTSVRRRAPRAFALVAALALLSNNLLIGVAQTMSAK